MGFGGIKWDAEGLNSFNEALKIFWHYKIFKV
jgi:hypothetical protein